MLLHVVSSPTSFTHCWNILHIPWFGLLTTTTAKQEMGGKFRHLCFSFHTVTWLHHNSRHLKVAILLKSYFLHLHFERQCNTHSPNTHILKQSQCPNSCSLFHSHIFNAKVKLICSFFKSVICYSSSAEQFFLFNLVV